MKTGQHTIIPENENHCVWMDAGLVNYKLCDKNFDCDTCSFDLIMKKQHHPFSERAVMQSEPSVREFTETDVVQRIMQPLTSALLPDDRLYFSNHSWLKKMNDGFCQIGVNALLAGFLHPVVGAVVVNKSSRVANESPFAWLIRDNETFTLRNPVPGIVMSTNVALTSKPSIVTTDCYDEGWIVTIAPQENPEKVSQCYTAEEFQPILERDMQWIESQLRLALKKQSSSVGSTMYDGGKYVETIEQFIGEKRYTQLLSRLIRLQ
jgi:glycine cleavage system H lipoate-binding protein